LIIILLGGMIFIVVMLSWVSREHFRMRGEERLLRNLIIHDLKGWDMKEVLRRKCEVHGIKLEDDDGFDEKYVIKNLARFYG
jgi:hypothetical protein